MQLADFDKAEIECDHFDPISKHVANITIRAARLLYVIETRELPEELLKIKEQFRSLQTQLDALPKKLLEARQDERKKTEEEIVKNFKEFADEIEHFTKDLESRTPDDPSIEVRHSEVMTIRTAAEVIESGYYRGAHLSSAFWLP